MLTRKLFITTVLGGAGALILSRMATSHIGVAGKVYAVTRTDAEWRARLTSDQYAVLRNERTERPYSSPLLHENRAGVFSCLGCDLPQFQSQTKFDSRTGWPSFWAALPGSVDETADHSLGLSRTAISCSRCGSHIGHVFNDGPRPTGLRYCMNGIALVFSPTTS